jgi:hypothetical protein
MEFPERIMITFDGKVPGDVLANVIHNLNDTHLIEVEVVARKQTKASGIISLIETDASLGRRAKRLDEEQLPWVK